MKKDSNRIGATLCSSMRPRSSTTSWLNKFKLLALVLTTMLSVNVWGADTEITSVANIQDGGTYYIKGVRSSTTYYLSFTDATGSQSGTESSTKDGAIAVTFNKVSNGVYTLKTPKGNYIAPGTSNGKIYVSTTATNVTASNQSSKIRLSITSSGTTWSIQKNSGAANFGGYKNTQTDITLIAAAAADPVTSLYLWEAGVQSENLKGTYKVGDKYTLPSTTEASCGDKVLVGWSSVEISTPSATKPTSNYYDKGAEVTLVADNTFYAVFADASNGGGSTTKSYGFEDSDDETLWIVDGPAKESGNAHSGSKSGKITTNNTYVQFKDKVKVTSFSYWFKRTSTNSNYNVYIETSTDGTNWETVDTKAMNSFNNGSYAVSPVEKTFDGTEELYVRFHCYNTTAIRYVDDVSITYSGGTSYSNYTTSCISTYTLLFSELKLPNFYGIFYVIFLAYVKQPLSMV